MSLNYPIKWKTVENTVKERLRDGSLLHTLSGMKKIKKQTKIFNRKLKRLHYLRSYKHFLHLKKLVVKVCQEEDETDDEPGLDFESYKKIHAEKSMSELREFVQSPEDSRSPRSLQKSSGDKHSGTNDSKYQPGSRSKRSISHSDELPSTSSDTESQSSQTKLSRSREKLASLNEENVVPRDEQKKHRADKKECKDEIVEDPIASRIWKKTVDNAVESDYKKVKSAAIEGNLIVRNRSRQSFDGETQYDATNKSKSCMEIKEKSKVSNDSESDDCSIGADASSPASSYGEISNMDSPHSRTDIVMTRDEEIGLKGNSSGKNDDKFTADTLNKDSGNNSLSDTDDSRNKDENDRVDSEMENDGYDNGIATENCFGMNNEETVCPADILEFEKSLNDKLNGVANTASLRTESSIPRLKLRCGSSMEDIKSSDSSNLYSEANGEIKLAVPICISQSRRRISCANTANDSKSNVKIRAIEHYDNGYVIFSKQQLSERKKQTIDNFGEKSIKKLQSGDGQAWNSRKFSEDCTLSEDESYYLKISSDHKASSSTNLNNSVSNKLLLKNGGQLKRNKSDKEYNLSENRSPRLNQSLNSSISSFSSRSHDEDFKNSVKSQLLLEIEKRSKKSPSKKSSSARAYSRKLNESLRDQDSLSFPESNDSSDKKRINNQLPMKSAQSLQGNGSTKESNSLKIPPQKSNRSSDIEDSLLSPESRSIKTRVSNNATDDGLMNNTPRKKARLHKQSTIRQIEFDSSERKSSETISCELRSAKNKDNSLDESRSEVNASKNIRRTPKNRPRPQNLEQLVAEETLTRDQTKPHFRLKDIGDDAEIWIMDVPKTIDPKDLEDQMLLLGGKSDLKLGDNDYEVTSKPSKKNRSVSCIFTTSKRNKEYKIVNIEPKGYMKFHQKLSTIPKTILIPSEETMVPFPKNLKTRHPLFGATYKDKI